MKQNWPKRLYDVPALYYFVILVLPFSATTNDIKVILPAQKDNQVLYTSKKI